MRKRFAFALSITLLFWASPALCAPQSTEAMYQDARRGFYDLLSSPSKMEDRRNWRIVINKFKAVITNHPSSARADDAQYTIGLLYERLYRKRGRSEDRDRAIRAFARVPENYPKSSLADDARRHIGLVKSYKPRPRTADSGRRKAKVPAPALKAETGKTRLTAVKRYSRDGYTRMILYFSEKAPYRTDRIKNPERVYVDLPGVQTRLPSVNRFDSGMVSALRVARNGGGTTRVVFDLAEENSRHTLSALHDPFRIVIDFGRDRRAPASRAEKKRESASSSGPAAASFARSYNTGKLKTIVIDPGHGGKDPGAIGPTGLKEKDITLAISRRLERTLERRLGCRVVLTRRTDRFLELDERTVIANSLNADLFISIHVNASRNRRARGIETYFLSPARSKDELETAARENMLARGSSNEVENDLVYIMSDMSNTQKVNDSVTLAKNVQRSLVDGARRRYRDTRDKGVKQAMFYVLWRAAMPSALVEAGFITNRHEERRLRNRGYINKLADSIADGVVRYSRTYTIARAN
ncbi:MAG: N-acetylmuramoyl-L-alanine amidase [Candidatus Nitrospinota bacterium M3_3B_026]